MRRRERGAAFVPRGFRRGLFSKSLLAILRWSLVFDFAFGRVRAFLRLGAAEHMTRRRDRLSYRVKERTRLASWRRFLAVLFHKLIMREGSGLCVGVGNDGAMLSRTRRACQCSTHGR